MLDMPMLLKPLSSVDDVLDVLLELELPVPAERDFDVPELPPLPLLESPVPVVPSLLE